jgi:hypothetical protein
LLLPRARLARAAGRLALEQPLQLREAQLLPPAAVVEAVVVVAVVAVVVAVPMQTLHLQLRLRAGPMARFV